MLSIRTSATIARFCLLLSWITAGHTSDPATVEAEMIEAGYRRLAEYDFIYPQSFLVYGLVGDPGRAEE